MRWSLLHQCLSCPYMSAISTSHVFWKPNLNNGSQIQMQVSRFHIVYLWAVSLWASPQKKGSLWSQWAVDGKTCNTSAVTFSRKTGCYTTNADSAVLPLFFFQFFFQRTCCTESFPWSCFCLTRVVLPAAFSPRRPPGWTWGSAPGFPDDWDPESHSRWNAAQPRSLKINTHACFFLSSNALLMACR